MEETLAAEWSRNDIMEETFAAEWSRNDIMEETPAAEWSRNDTVEDIFIEVEKQYCIYIMTNHKNTVLCTGVTNDLQRRVYEHKNKLVEGFTKRYNLTRLVYYELCGDIEGAKIREKQIKAGSRRDKMNLIDSVNRDWHDLYNEL